MLFGKMRWENLLDGTSRHGGNFMLSRTIVLMFVAILAPVNVYAGTIPAILIGTWQLVSRIDRDAGGRIVVADPSLGSDPIGYLIYDDAGRVAVQIMKRNRAAASCEETAATASNLAHINGYDAYTGTVEIDESKHLLTHVLETSLSLGDVGKRLTRHYDLKEDTLVLSYEVGDATKPGLTRTLTWHRLTSRRGNH